MNQTLKVGFFKIDPYIIEKKDGTYEGVLYDIWMKIEKNLQLKTKHIFIDNINFNKELNAMFENQKYDVLIGPISIIEERIKKVNFTRPVLLNKIVVGYIPNQSFLIKFYKILSKTILIPLISLLVIGFLLGNILYYFEPKRGHLRAIMSSIASMFGEMGFVSERSTLKISGMIVVFFIMLISFYSTIFLQAITTDKFISLSDRFEIDRNNIKGKRILTLKGSIFVDIFKNTYKCQVDGLDTEEQVVKNYLNNQNMYDGFVLDYESAKFYMKKYTNITITNDNFGNDELAFAIGKNNIRLNRLIDMEIVKMQDNFDTRKICIQYLDEEGTNNCDI